MVTEERKQRLAPWRCFSWFRECTIGGRCPAISFSVTTHPCSYLEADMPGYDSRGMPESTPCEWSMPQGYCGASASLVQNIVWAANPVLPITFDFLHFTHKQSHWLRACRYSLEPGWHFNVTEIFIRSQHQLLCLYKSSQQNTTRNHKAVFCLIFWKKNKKVVHIMWSWVYCSNLERGAN